MHILGLAGSARRESLNRHLLKYLLGEIQSRGHQTETFEFSEVPLPLYDGDLEAESGLPDEVLQLRSAILAADAVVITSPEFNASITPLLKNAIDWASRTDQETGQANVWAGKVVMLAGASPGGLGGLRALRVVREVLNEVMAITVPQQVSVGGGLSSYGPDGQLANERTKALSDGAITAFLQMAERLKA